MSRPLQEDSVALRAALTQADLAPLVRLTAAALATHAVQLRLFDPDRHVQQCAGLPEAWTRSSEDALHGLSERVVRSGDPVIRDDLRTDRVPELPPAIEAAGIVACAVLPLVLPDGTVIGTLCVVDVQPHAWTDQELEVIRDAAACATREVQSRLTLTESRRAGRYFRALVENATEIITVLDEEGVILYESPSLTRVLGYSPDERIGRSAFELVHPEDLPRVREAFREVIETPDRTLSVEYRIHHRDGEWRMLSSTGTNGLHDPAVRGVAVTSRDVTARRQAEEQLRVQKAYFERLFESAPEAIVLLDVEDRVLHVNPEFTRIFGYSAEEAVGRPINSIIVPEAERAESRAITERVASGESVHVETTRLRKDGSPVEVSILGTPIEMGSDRLGVFGIYRDITARKETEARLAAQTEQLRTLSLTDELTGLSNRRGFFALAEHEVSLARRSGTTLVLLFADVDDMKRINDEFGHAVGDHALVDAASVLTATFRDSDVLARIGGDEFAVLAWVDASPTTDTLLERLQNSIDLHNAHEDRLYSLSMSVGAAPCDPGSPTPLDDLLREADAAMYQAKRSRGAPPAGPERTTPS